MVRRLTQCICFGVEVAADLFKKLQFIAGGVGEDSGTLILLYNWLI
jgi:hypothetical protein